MAQHAELQPSCGLPLASEQWGQLVKQLLEEGRSATFVVRGVSMLPTLRDGDRVTLRHLGNRPAQAGEIVAFQRGPCLCLHRVLAVVHDGRSARVTHYLTAGDGLLVHDGRQPADAIVGRVVRVQTGRGDWSPFSIARRVQSAARTWLGLHPRVRARLRAVKQLAPDARRSGRADRTPGVDL